MAEPAELAAVHVGTRLLHDDPTVNGHKAAAAFVMAQAAEVGIVPPDTLPGWPPGVLPQVDAP